MSVLKTAAYVLSATTVSSLTIVSLFYLLTGRGSRFSIPWLLEGESNAKFI